MSSDKPSTTTSVSRAEVKPFVLVGDIGELQRTDVISVACSLDFGKLGLLASGGK